MYHRTNQKLLSMTDHAEFERMVLDLLACVGYEGVNARDLGLVDSGRDGLSYYCPSTGAWVVFSLQRQWKSRYRRDMERALDSRRMAKRFLFCTNRTIPLSEQEAMVKAGADYEVQVHFFDGERLRQMLDTVCTDVRQTYLGLPDHAVTRRLLRYVVIDPENEVAAPESDLTARFEGVVPAARVARGIYALLRGQDLSDVCENGREQHALSGLLDAYVAFRRAVTALDKAAKETGADPAKIEESLDRLPVSGGRVEPPLPSLALPWNAALAAAGACDQAVAAVLGVSSLMEAAKLSVDFPVAEPFPFPNRERVPLQPLASVAEEE